MIPSKKKKQNNVENDMNVLNLSNDRGSALGFKQN
jgi:hypothetical protein